MTGGYLRPREKLKQRGKNALTNQELLQLLIGSGNGFASVSRIAKRTLKLLQVYGGRISYDQLSSVSGLGPARISQIISAFEIARRYPGVEERVILSDQDLIDELRSGLSADLRLLYSTLDGAGGRMFSRQIKIDRSTNVNLCTKEMFGHILKDDAVSIVVCHGAKKYHKTPTLFDLSLSRSIRVAASMFGVNVRVHSMISGENIIDLGTK